MPFVNLNNSTSWGNVTNSSSTSSTVPAAGATASQPQTAQGDVSQPVVPATNTATATIQSAAAVPTSPAVASGSVSPTVVVPETSAGGDVTPLPEMPQVREIVGPEFSSGSTNQPLQAENLVTAAASLPVNQDILDSFDKKLAQINAKFADALPVKANDVVATPPVTMPEANNSTNTDTLPKLVDLPKKDLAGNAIPTASVSQLPAPSPVDLGDDDIVLGTESASKQPDVLTPIAGNASDQKPLPEPVPAGNNTIPTPVTVKPLTGSEKPTPPAASMPAVAEAVQIPVPAAIPSSSPVVGANKPPVVQKPIAKEAPSLGTLPPLPKGIEVPAVLEQSLQGMESKVVLGAEAGAKLVNKEYSLDEILNQAVAQGASDVHLNANYRAIARINGKLVPLQSEVLTSAKIKSMLAKVVGPRREKELDEISDLDLAYVLPGSVARFRVNIYRERESYAAVFRLIPERIPSMQELFLPNMLREFLTLEQGLILVTGATGSGKSTTIASLVNEINTQQPKHIVTIEDPIEYVYPIGQAVVSQRAVNSDTETWASALRSILRQDPDVVVIGEMRDLETISAALRVAETGHLVFATLHTNSAAQSVDRIIDVFPEYQQNQIRTQLSSVLTAVVSQKLVPVNGGSLRVAVEIMIVNAAVRAAIRESRVYQIDNMIQTGADEGMISMEKSLIEMVHQGMISPEIAQQFANKPNDLLALLR